MSTGLITHHTHARPHHTIYFPEKQLILADFGGFWWFSMNNMGTRPPKISIKYSRASQESSLQLSSLFQSDPTSTRFNKNRIIVENDQISRVYPCKGIPPQIPVPVGCGYVPVTGTGTSPAPEGHGCTPVMH
jgi:hypothetical protein